jgi:hypothetical protein
MNKRNKLYHFCCFALITLVFVRCYNERDFEPSKIALSDSAFQLLPTSASVPADSISTIIITAELPYNADTSKSTATLRTDLGTFVESGSQTITLNLKNFPDSAKKIAIATLRAGMSTGIAHMQATFYSQIRYTSVNFTNSYPDLLYLSASALTIKPQNGSTGEVNFTGKIYKQSGAPSQRNQISLVVDDSNYHSIGKFRTYNDLSDATGTTQYTYVLGDSTLNKFNYYGKLYAIASVQTDINGGMNRDTIILISSQ